MKRLVVALVLVIAGCSSGGSSGSANGFCDELRALQQSSTSPNDDQFAAALDRLANVAPAEIKAEMQQVRDFDKVLSEASPDSSKLGQLDSSSSQIDSALAKVTAYAQDKCGIDLTGSSSTKFSSVASTIN